MTIKNTGSTSVTVSEIYINNGADLLDTDLSLDANTQADQSVTFTWAAGSAYQIKIVTSAGNPFVYQATGPS
jgi:hypothetical protein